MLVRLFILQEEPLYVTVMTVLPFFFALTTPVGLTEATLFLELTNLTLPAFTTKPPDFTTRLTLSPLEMSSFPFTIFPCTADTENPEDARAASENEKVLRREKTKKTKTAQQS